MLDEELKEEPLTRTGLEIVTEVLNRADFEVVARYQLSALPMDKW